MQRPRTAVFMILALALSSSAFAADYKLGEVIVKYKENTDEIRTRESMNTFYDSIGVQEVRRYHGLVKGFEQLIFDETSDVMSVILELSKDPKVAYAQPNYILRALPISDDFSNTLVDAPGSGIPCLFPGIEFPPGCEDASSGKPGKTRPALKDCPADVNPPKADPELAKAYGLGKIGALDAWKQHLGSKDFIVADIDTGIDYNHEDLAFNVWRNPNPGVNKDVVGFDFVHNDGLPFDDQGHGTHTSGTIGAVGGNGVGISGVAPRVSIMGVKFLSAEGSGTTADAIRAIDYAIGHGAKVLSNSWGGPADKGNQALKDIIEKARQNDVLFVAAAGNDGTDNDGSDPKYPASFDNDNLIAVAATDANDKMAYFSNYGKKTTHLGAPGKDVYSTIPGGKYKNASGTSMACPHVAGAAALIWSAHPEWTYRQVKAALLQSTDPLPDLKDKTVSGGRLNVNKALMMTEASLEVGLN